MFVHSLWSCNQDLINQKVKMIDFQTIWNFIDYVKIIYPKEMKYFFADQLVQADVQLD